MFIVVCEEKRSGAGEAWRAHNSQVGGSKPLSANQTPFSFHGHVLNSGGEKEK